MEVISYSCEEVIFWESYILRGVSYQLVRESYSVILGEFFIKLATVEKAAMFSFVWISDNMHGDLFFFVILLLNDVSCMHG